LDIKQPAAIDLMEELSSRLEKSRRAWLSKHREIQIGAIPWTMQEGVSKRVGVLDIEP
jgi:hypothetical protein